MNRNEGTLFETDRLQRLVRHIPDPDYQCPSLLVLIGNKAKAVALREAFRLKRHRGFTTKRVSGEVHLHLDPDSAFGVKPLLIADTDLLNPSTQAKETQSRCHNTKTRHLASQHHALSAIAKDVYVKLLGHFTDVFSTLR